MWVVQYKQPGYIAVISISQQTQTYFYNAGLFSYLVWLDKTKTPTSFCTFPQMFRNVHNEKETYIKCYTISIDWDSSFMFALFWNSRTDLPKPSWESEWGRKAAELDPPVGWNQIWTSCRLLKTQADTNTHIYLYPYYYYCCTPLCQTPWWCNLEILNIMIHIAWTETSHTSHSNSAFINTDCLWAEFYSTQNNVSWHQTVSAGRLTWCEHSRV